MILTVALIILVVVGAIKIVRSYGCSDLIKFFRSGNVIVAGNKGRGKDLLFQYVISRREKDGEIHAANIRYTDKTKIRPLTYYSLKSNARKNFINGQFEREEQTFIEREDYYCSDIGNLAPAWAHNELEKMYPTQPIVYSLSRHLGDFRIHCNAQTYELIWDKLRKQADYAVYCEKCKVIGRVAIQRIVMYDRRLTAEEYIQPYKVRKNLFGFAKAEDYARAHEFNAKYGFVKRVTFWHILPKKPYNTREFYNKLYKKEPPTLDRRKRRKKKSEK